MPPAQAEPQPHAHEDAPARRPRKAARTLRRLAVRLALVYLAVVGILYLIQSRLVYYPSSRIDVRPDTVGLDYEDLKLTAADGVILSAWYLPARDPRGTLLFCHGNAGNMAGRIQDAAAALARGLNVLMFDYRGFGESAGSPDEEGTCRDVEAAWRYLVETRRERPERIIVHGRSLGGAVAAHLAARQQPGGLVLESTFTSMPELAGDLLWWMPARWMCRFRYPTRENLKDVTCPVLVVHSRDDGLIPYRHGRALFAAAAEPKHFCQIHGPHNRGFVDSEDVYGPALDRFADEVLGARPVPAEPPPAPAGHGGTGSTSSRPKPAV